MSKNKNESGLSTADGRPGGKRPGGDGESEEFTIKDRRHWNVDAGDAQDELAAEEPRQPSVIEGYRQRAEAAEAKLLEYIAAFKTHQEDQEQFRDRLAADVDRKVELQFGEMVGELLGTVDDLDLALAHCRDVPEAEPLTRGVEMARVRFLATLENHGIRRIELQSVPFDPNEAEAVRIDPVDSAERHGVVTETLQPGYSLGDRVIRAAKVAVGRHDG